MINNFDLISSKLKFENEHEFYFLQIIQRKKEVPDLGSNNRVIKTYYVYSLEKLEKYKQEIIDLCTQFNARAYIHLNRRNSKVLAFEMLELLAKNIKSEDYNQLGNLYNSVCGHHHSDKDKTWIIDLDGDEVNNIKQIKETIEYLEPLLFTNLDTGKCESKIIAEIPTKNGIHLITKPFNSQKFGVKYPNIDLHKNNPTILFIPGESYKDKMKQLVDKAKETNPKL